MKFLIQKINGQIRHDFSFTLLESIRFKNWLTSNNKKDKIVVKYANTFEITDPDMIYPNPFKPQHKNYIPVGSVEFVTDFLMYFHNTFPKPINVPEELFDPCFTQRRIFNGNHMDLEDCTGRYFVKSNSKIKGFTEVVECKKTGNQGTVFSVSIPAGNYQISEYLFGIESEWRAFVYQGKLVGLQNYSGDFTRFPDVATIKSMIYAYKSAPMAYTLDVAVCDHATVIIEVHNFFSCGLYGFADHSIYPNMLNRAFHEYVFFHKYSLMEESKNQINKK
jgi:hypothetical protein